mmetsp:Transcript_28949/g.48179  ORF Transcript_28949/g.48179 Transcript_28949/m.48179 type:complete len:205 (+) Transcript_28949:430-1044(+)
MSFDHSPGDRTVARGFNEVGRKSSSSAVKIVESFEGSFESNVEYNPVILSANSIEDFSPCVNFRCSGSLWLLVRGASTGSKISSMVHPENKLAESAVMRTSERRIPKRLFNILRSHFEASNPPTAMYPRTLFVVNDRLGGNMSDSASAVNSRVLPSPSSPKMANISPFLHCKLAPRTAHARLVVWAAQRSRTVNPAEAETDAIS